MDMLRGMSQWIVVMLLVLILFSLFESMAAILTSSVPAVLMIAIWYLVWKMSKTGFISTLTGTFSALSPVRIFRRWKLNLAYRRFQNKTKASENGTIICRSCGKSLDPFSFGVSGRCPGCGTKIL